MAYCRSCGRTVTGDEQFCRTCGASLSENPEEKRSGPDPSGSVARASGAGQGTPPPTGPGQGPDGYWGPLEGGPPETGQAASSTSWRPPWPPPPPPPPPGPPPVGPSMTPPDGPDSRKNGPSRALMIVAALSLAAVVVLS